jgi:hypothetical protein
MCVKDDKVEKIVGSGEEDEEFQWTSVEDDGIKVKVTIQIK